MSLVRRPKRQFQRNGSHEGGPFQRQILITILVDHVHTFL